VTSSGFATRTRRCGRGGSREPAGVPRGATAPSPTHRTQAVRAGLFSNSGSGMSAPSVPLPTTIVTAASGFPGSHGRTGWRCGCPRPGSIRSLVDGARCLFSTSIGWSAVRVKYTTVPLFRRPRWWRPRLPAPGPRRRRPARRRSARRQAHAGGDLPAGGRPLPATSWPVAPSVMRTTPRSGTPSPASWPMPHDTSSPTRLPSGP
jgi:hypothetical protein